MKKILVPKVPNVVVSTPTQNTYQGLSQTELLAKVKILHEALLKTNKYLMDVHRISIYNWDETDAGNIIVELPEDNKGFLLDSILRLRGNWDPKTNTPELLDVDETRRGWLYKVSTSEPFILYGYVWKQNDYAMYDEMGVLHNVQSDFMSTLFTPIVPMNTSTVATTVTVDAESNIQQIQSDVLLSASNFNDLLVKPDGLFADGFKKSLDFFQFKYDEPLEDNTSNVLSIVFLTNFPKKFYKGHLYLMPSANVVVDEEPGPPLVGPEEKISLAMLTNIFVGADIKTGLLEHEVDITQEVTLEIGVTI